METLNNHQKIFVSEMAMNYKLGKFGMYLLEAAAGSGKTYSCNSLINELGLEILNWEQTSDGAKVLAPTHKAKKVLENNGIRGAQTVHQFLGGSMRYHPVTGESIFIFSPKTYTNCLIIVDECSMITDELFELLKVYSDDNIVLFCGDPLQLPPINKKSVINEDGDEPDILNRELSKTFGIINKFVLVENMRSDTLSLKMLSNARAAIASERMPDSINTCCITELMKLYDSGVDPIDICTLAFTNARTKFYNDLIRQKLFNVSRIEDLEEFYKGETLVFSGYRSVNKIVYHTSDIIVVKHLELETIKLSRKKCQCMLENELLKTCIKCGIGRHNINSFDITFNKCVDGNEIIWYKPYTASDAVNLLKLKKHYKNHCKKMKDSKIWKDYYDFLNTYDANLKYTYASTIHKSQGSEYKYVFVDRQNVLDTCRTNIFLKTRAYYTGLSRMRTAVYDIVCNIDVVDSNTLVGDFFKFGKHQGKSYDYVIKNDMGYTKWLLSMKGALFVHFQNYHKCVCH